MIIEDQPKPFLEHLADLRITLLGCLAAWGVTPGPDVFSQIIMAVPMMLLYEACIWIIWLAERKKRDAGGPSYAKALRRAGDRRWIAGRREGK